MAQAMVLRAPRPIGQAPLTLEARGDVVAGVDELVLRVSVWRVPDGPPNLRGCRKSAGNLPTPGVRGELGSREDLAKAAISRENAAIHISRSERARPRRTGASRTTKSERRRTPPARSRCNLRCHARARTNATFPLSPLSLKGAGTNATGRVRDVKN
jgi:hypothetical protein